MGPKFHETPMGRKFIEGTIPRLVEQLTKLNENLGVLLSSRTEEVSDQSKCQNCGWTGDEGMMKNPWPDIPDLTERMAPGEPVPSGECPECGALCHPVKP